MATSDLCREVTGRGDVRRYRSLFQSTGLSLFPQNVRNIDFDCSCPDWGDPCKHSAAVYYQIAAQLDVDPFILFHIRGQQRDAILQSVNLVRDQKSF